MTNNTYPQIINPPLNGEAVDQVTAGRYISQLTRRTDYLRAIIESLSSSSGRIIKTGAVLDPLTVKGDWVYLDVGSSIFKPAIAGGELDENGFFQATNSSLAVGVIIEKTAVDAGTVLLFGNHDFPVLSAIPMTDMIEEGQFIPGKYYLSRRIPGKMTRFPSAPVIYLGVFSEGSSFVDISPKDLFESHYHYSFNLFAKPSASQNYDQTGWTSFGAAMPSDVYVDYFNNGVAPGGGNPTPELLLTIRRVSTGSPTTSSRVEIFRTGGDLMGIDIFSNPAYTNPVDPGSGVVSQTPIAWPQYGEYVLIPGTDLEVAFTRKDGTYANTLAQDIAAGIIDPITDRWKFYLPNDYEGWTNANALDDNTPSGSKFRYVLTGHPSVNNVFPPIPIESAILELNGSGLASPSDYRINNTGLFWMVNEREVDRTFTPWPFDYSVLGGMDFQLNGKILKLFFIRTILSTSNSTVLSLTSGSSSLRIVDALSGNTGVSGHLKLLLDLAFNAGATVDETSNPPHALVSISGQTFNLGSVVRLLEAGAGITLASDQPGNKPYGKVRISTSPQNFSGPVHSVSLDNAKELIENGVPVVYLSDPSIPMSFIAKTVIPTLGGVPASPVFEFFARFLGTDSVAPAAATQAAIIKLTYYVVRSGINIDSISEANAALVSYYTVTFSNYTAMTTGGELPLAPGVDPDKYELNVLNLNPNSPIAPAGLAAGDIVYVRVQRVSTNPETSETDTYTGRVGFVGMRWAVK